MLKFMLWLIFTKWHSPPPGYIQNISQFKYINYLSGLYHLHPLQAANCCHNSRLVVDEDDLKGYNIKENYHVLVLIVNQFQGNFHLKTLGCRKIRSVFRDVK